MLKRYSKRASDWRYRSAKRVDKSEAANMRCLAFFNFNRAIAWFALAILLSITLAVPSFAATSIRALDEPAITVKTPSEVPIIAITRAGGRLVAVGVHGVIVYSDDNGATWTQSPDPVSAALTAVAFATAKEGWAAGHYGVVLHSVDGGLTWKLQLNGIQAAQLTMAAARTAVVANLASPGLPYAMRRARAFVAGGADKPFLSIWAQNSQHVILFGAYRMAMISVDGGKAWQDISLNVGDPLSHNIYDAAAIGPKLCIAGEVGGVFCSTDGGMNFPAVTAPGSTTLFGLVGVGGDSVFTFGVAGAAYRSADGGQTWRQQSLGTTANLTAAIVLRSGEVVVAAEDGKIYVSSDQAQSFRPLPLAVPMALYALVQAANGDVVVTGSNGIMPLPAGDFAQN